MTNPKHLEPAVYWEFRARARDVEAAQHLRDRAEEGCRVAQRGMEEFLSAQGLPIQGHYRWDDATRMVLIEESPRQPEPEGVTEQCP